MLALRSLSNQLSRPMGTHSSSARQLLATWMLALRRAALRENYHYLALTALSLEFDLQLTFAVMYQATQKVASCPPQAKM